MIFGFNGRDESVELLGGNISQLSHLAQFGMTDLSQAKCF